MSLSGLGWDTLSPKREGDFPPHPVTAQPTTTRPFSSSNSKIIKIYATSDGPVAFRGNPNLVKELTLNSLSTASGSLNSL